MILTPITDRDRERRVGLEGRRPGTYFLPDFPIYWSFVNGTDTLPVASDYGLITVSSNSS